MSVACNWHNFASSCHHYRTPLTWQSYAIWSSHRSMNFDARHAADMSMSKENEQRVERIRIVRLDASIGLHASWFPSKVSIFLNDAQQIKSTSADQIEACIDVHVGGWAAHRTWSKKKIDGWTTSVTSIYQSRSWISLVRTCLCMPNVILCARFPLRGVSAEPKIVEDFSLYFDILGLLFVSLHSRSSSLLNRARSTQWLGFRRFVAMRLAVKKVSFDNAAGSVQECVGNSPNDQVSGYDKR